MGDPRVYVNQGRYDENPKKLLSIRKRAIENVALGIQDAVEQRLKKCHPNIYQRKVGQLYRRERDPKFNCCCNNPSSLDEICRDILNKTVPYHALSCDACWQEDLSTTWGYYGFSSKIVSKEAWAELCDDSSYAKFVE